MVESGLTKLISTKRSFDKNHEWCFEEGDVREAFEQVFKSNAEYILFQTIVNQEAVDTLSKYCASRASFDDPWKIKEITKKDKPKYVPGANDECNGLYFGTGLIDVYEEAIEIMASDQIGKKNYATYSMVKTNGVHNLDRDISSIFWPRIYIVNAEKESKLKRIIANLSEDESFKILSQLEAPQNYKMAEITLLHNLGIKPIVRLKDKEIKLDAKNLSIYVDFLSQMSQSYKWTGHVSYVD